MSTSFRYIVRDFYFCRANAVVIIYLDCLNILDEYGVVSRRDAESIFRERERELCTRFYAPKATFVRKKNYLLARG